jgi:hypothetical protein
MGAAYVSVHVAEDVELDDHLCADAGRAPNGWLYLGGDGHTALWGSPAALRRLAAALVLVAERAEGLVALRDAAGGDGRSGDAGLRAVDTS